MSRPIFVDIEEASGRRTPVQDGGEIDLEGLKPCRGRTWDVGQPDPHDPAEAVEGGAVELARGRGRDAVQSPARRVVNSRGVGWEELTGVIVQLTPAVVLIVLVFLGYGFVAVVNHDIEQNRLNLPTYAKVLGWLAGGLLGLAGGGAALKSFRPDKAKRGGGSG